VFSTGKTNKFNLEAAIIKGKGKVYFSTVADQNKRAFQVDDDV
jgi:hypothetical protein